MPADGPLLDRGPRGPARRSATPCPWSRRPAASRSITSSPARRTGPERWRVRAPTYPNLQGVPAMLLDNQFADFPIILGQHRPLLLLHGPGRGHRRRVGPEPRPRPGRARAAVAEPRRREEAAMSIVYPSRQRPCSSSCSRPLFEGVIRRITARVQSRQGPPLVQPYYDLLKLARQGEDQLGRATGPSGSRPLAALASILAVVGPHPLRRPSRTRSAAASTPSPSSTS